jgi:Bacterial lectin
MRFEIRRCFSLLVSILLLLTTSAIAQQIRYFPDFTNASSPSAAHLRLNGSSGLAKWQSQTVLRLTDSGSGTEQSSAFFTLQQPLTQGFTTWFQFQIHNSVCCNPADGFAFVIQNSTATDSTQGASGSGVTAMGSEDGGLGYSGINNSLAVEFDIYDDPWDPNSNHIAVQTCGGNPSKFNSPVHEPGSYTIGNNHNVTSCLLGQDAINTNIPALGGTCTEEGCTDGAVHQVVIGYTPPATNQQQGLLQVWLDPTFYPGTHTPIQGAPTVVSAPYTIVYSSTNPLGLALGNSKGTFYAGFTGSQPGSEHHSRGSSSGTGTTIDVFAWEFTNQQPVQITQMIASHGEETPFVFGAHQQVVTYPTTFNNDMGIQMTVLATPVNQQTFYMNRLQGTQFADENCIVYLGTGSGTCVVYSVTCSLPNGTPVACPSDGTFDIAICSKFQTTNPVSEATADYLEADPIGSNNWCSIFSSFSNNNDPVVSGRGQGFSDLVATFSGDGQGPACNQGGLKAATKQVEKALRPPQGGICPPVM